MLPPDCGDDGESLLEILMAVAIIGIAFSALLAGLATAVTTSGINREQADDSNYVRAIAESVEAASFLPCADATHYEAALAQVSTPSGATRSLSVAYWEPLASTWSTTCSSATELHRVRITTLPADARAGAPAPLDVLRRKP